MIGNHSLQIFLSLSTCSFLHFKTPCVSRDKKKGPNLTLILSRIMTLVLKGNISCWFCLLIILWFSVFVNFTSKCEIQIGWGRRSHMDATSNLRARDGSPIFLLWNVCGLYLIEGLTVIIWTLATHLVSNFRLSAVWTKWHHSWRNS